MRARFVVSVLTLMALSGTASADCPALLDHTKRPLMSREPVNLCEQYAGQVLLVVNTASRCGFTPQYEGLENIYQKYRDQGFAVLGFPSNDFGGQEPGEEKDIQKFCKTIYGVQFPMFEKTPVKAGTSDAFYQALARDGGGAPKWNFHKYLIDREGRVVETFGSVISPESDKITGAIEALL